MTRDLPHLGLGGPQRSMYGDNSTIGEQAKRDREVLEDQLADLLGLRDPIRVQASVGRPTPELTSDA